MREFRSLNDDERSRLVYMLEQNSVMTYPAPCDEDEKHYFAAVADMRTIVTDKSFSQR